MLRVTKPVLPINKKRREKGKTQKSIAFPLCRLWGTTYFDWLSADLGTNLWRPAFRHSTGYSLYMREIGTICHFGFLPNFVAFIASTFVISPLQCSVSGCRNGHFGGRKGQMVHWGSRTPKRLTCLQNNGKANKSRIGLITGIGLKSDKHDYETEERTPKGQRAPFSRSHRSPFPRASALGR